MITPTEQPSRYYAAQSTGKVHRVPVDGMTRTLCGIPAQGAPWSFWRADQLGPDEDPCSRCWRPTTPNGPTVDDAIAQLIDTEVARAVDCYRHHMPGHGEYVLVRLGMRLARLERVVAEARDALAD